MLTLGSEQFWDICTTSTSCSCFPTSISEPTESLECHLETNVDIKLNRACPFSSFHKNYTPSMCFVMFNWKSEVFQKSIPLCTAGSSHKPRCQHFPRLICQVDNLPHCILTLPWPISHTSSRWGETPWPVCSREPQDYGDKNTTNLEIHIPILVDLNGTGYISIYHSNRLIPFTQSYRLLEQETAAKMVSVLILQCEKLEPKWPVFAATTAP